MCSTREYILDRMQRMTNLHQNNNHSRTWCVFQGVKGTWGRARGTRDMSFMSAYCRILDASRLTRALSAFWICSRRFFQPNFIWSFHNYCRMRFIIWQWVACSRRFFQPTFYLIVPQLWVACSRRFFQSNRMARYIDYFWNSNSVLQTTISEIICKSAMTLREVCSLMPFEFANHFQWAT
jgi:hypothetical protein